MYTFINLQKDPLLFLGVKNFFERKVSIFYGNQNVALKKIEEGKDRETSILLCADKAVGLVVYKRSLTSKFEQLGVKKTFEIKTLGLFNPKKDGRKKYGSRLLLKVLQEAIKLDATCVIVSVSTANEEAVYFFMKMGFKVIGKFYNKYIKGMDELLCILEKPIELLYYLSCLETIEDL